MERLFEVAARSVRTCRVASCCCVAPLRPGLLVAAYLNVLVALVLIVGTASGADMFWPIVARVQAQLLEDAASPAVCVLAPAADLAATALLLCGLHRSDPVLLRAYMYYGAACIAVSLVVYSLVVALISALYLLIIILSLLYQAYILVLVRSLIVEIQLQSSGDIVVTFDKRLGTAAAAAVSDVESGREPRRPESPALPYVQTLDEDHDKTDNLKKGTTFKSSTLTRSTDSDNPAAFAKTESVIVDTKKNTGAAVTPVATAAIAVDKRTVNTPIVENKTPAVGGLKGVKVSAVKEETVATPVPSVPRAGAGAAQETARDDAAVTENATEAAASDAAAPAPAPHKKRRGIFSRKAKESGAKKDGES